MTDDRQSERATAVAAADGTCPRCGAARAPDDRYCLECGLALPRVDGRVAALRRAWIRRLGWYPGDWVWVSVLTLLVAVAGAAAAIAVTENRASGASHVVRATGGVPVVTPTAVPPTTGTLPTAPEPTTSSGPPNGRTIWPASENGWTIVLVSYPKTNGRPAAYQTATRAASHGLKQVGVLDSSRYASLQPGYYVVFTGIYPTRADAENGVPTARQAGFGGAYSRQISR